MMLLAVVRRDLGSLDAVARVVKVNGFINAAPEFREHPKAMEGYSDLFFEIFGDSGKHVRTSVGVASLPFGNPH